jgi:hypothetical protein
MIAASYINLPSWEANVNNVEEDRTECNTDTVEMEIEFEESDEVIYPVFEIVDLPFEDLQEVTYMDYDEECEIAEVQEQFQSEDSSSFDADETFKMVSSLRSTCIAHTLQLVVKDGLKGPEVIFLRYSLLIIFRSSVHSPH